MPHTPSSARRRGRISRRSIAGWLAAPSLGIAALALTAAGSSAFGQSGGTGPLNPALVPKDLAASVLPSGFAGEMRMTQGENCVFDYDRDGIRDVFLSAHGMGWRLLRGRANGTFVEAERFPTTDRHGCVVGDFGGVTAGGAYTGPDGRIDIYASIGACRGTCDSPFPNELWLQRPDGTYLPPEQDARSKDAKARPNAGSDAAYAFGLADEHGRGREPTVLDVNRDGLLDIFLGQDEGILFDSRNRLFLNRNGRFQEVPLPGGRAKSEVGSVSSTAADFDGDGWTDLVNCSDDKYAKIQVYRNQAGTLVEVADQIGLGGISDAKDAEFADMNGDGRLDLVLVRFSWVEVRLNRANTFATVDYSRRIDGGMDLAVGDADGDGLEDVYAALLHNGAGGGRGDDLLLRNTGRTDEEGLLALEDVPIPQTREGNGDTVQAVRNWGGTNRAAFLVNNGKWTDAGPWQLIFLTGPPTGPPVEPPVGPPVGPPIGPPVDPPVDQPGNPRPPNVPTGPQSGPEIGVTERPAVKDTPLFCTKYPRLRRTLARQLVAAKRARARAEAPAARAKAAKRVKAVKIKQRKANVRFRGVCRVAPRTTTKALASQRATDAYRATTFARAASDGSGSGSGCTCPICCGIAPGALTAAAPTVVSAASASVAQAVIASAALA